MKLPTALFLLLVTVIAASDSGDAPMINGWWANCLADREGDDRCLTLDPLETPVQTSINTCYSNPYANRRTVSFLSAQQDDGKYYMFHLIFKSTKGFIAYSPRDCNDAGVCSCANPPELEEIVDVSMKLNRCIQDGDGSFDCVFVPVDNTEACVVPSTGTDFNGDMACSMAASFVPPSPSEQLPQPSVMPTLGEQTPAPSVRPLSGSQVMPAQLPPPSFQPIISDQLPPPSFHPTIGGLLPPPSLEPVEGQLPQPSIEPTVGSGSIPPPSDQPAVVQPPIELWEAVIQGWWSACNPTTEGPWLHDECRGDLTLLPAPLPLKVNTCYSNPYLEPRTVSFLSHDASTGLYSWFHLIFDTDAGVEKFAPTSCDNQGVCDCDSPSELEQLRLVFTLANRCMHDGDGAFDCVKQPLNTDSQRSCFVGSASTDEEGVAKCSMVAALGGVSPDVIVPDSASSVPSVAPKVITNEASSTPSAISTEAPVIGSPPPTATPMAVIPSNPQESFSSMAIAGWWKECSIADNSVDAVCVPGSKVVLDEPIPIGFAHCYSNPLQDGRSVSFFVHDENNSEELMGYHIIFDTRESYEKYKPVQCSSVGVCDCKDNPDLMELKDTIVREKRCHSADGITCKYQRTTVRGAKELDCFIPLVTGDDETYCALTASLIDFGGGSSTTDAVPKETEEMNSAAITGWWNKCINPATRNSDEVTACDEGTNIQLSEPLFLDFEHCYSNPYHGRSVTFYAKKGSNVISYHLIFEDDARWNEYKPQCTPEGLCDCTSSQIWSIRQKILEESICENGDGYTCVDRFFQKDVSVYNGCYVPDITSVENGSVQCAMTASLESKNSPESTTGTSDAQQASSGGKKRKLSNGVVSFLVILLLLAVFAGVYFLVVRYRSKKKATGYPELDESDAVWDQRQSSMDRIKAFRPSLFARKDSNRSSSYLEEEAATEVDVLMFKDPDVNPNFTTPEFSIS